MSELGSCNVHGTKCCPLRGLASSGSSVALHNLDGSVDPRVRILGCRPLYRHYDRLVVDQ